MTTEADIIAGVLAREQAMLRYRRPFEAGWRDIVTYVAPSYYAAWPEQRGVEALPARGDVVFDDTSSDCVRVLAQALDSTLFSGNPWRLCVRGLDDPPPVVADWLEASAEVLHAAMTDERTGYEAARLITAAARPAFGASCLFWDEFSGDGQRKPHLIAEAVPPMQLAISVGRGASIGSVVRRWQVSASAAAETWGEDSLSEASRALLKSDPTMEIEVLHEVAPAKTGRFPWKSTIVDTRGNKIIRRGGYARMPYVFSRWAHIPGQVWGWGLGQQTIQSVINLNADVKANRQAAAQLADPTTYVPAGTFSGEVGDTGKLVVRRQPGKILQYQPLFGMTGEVVRKWPQPDALPISIQQVVAQREELRRLWLYYDLRIPDEGAMTATEVIARRQENIRRARYPLALTIAEEAIPSGEWCFRRLAAASALPRPPEAGIVDRTYVDFDSPIEASIEAARGQAVRVWLGDLAALAQADPAVMGVMDIEKAARFLRGAVGAPQDIVRSVEEVEALRQQALEVQQQAQTLAALQQGSQAALNIAKSEAVVRG